MVLQIAPSITSPIRRDNDLDVAATQLEWVAYYFILRSKSSGLGVDEIEASVCVEFGDGFAYVDYAEFIRVGIDVSARIWSKGTVVDVGWGSYLVLSSRRWRTRALQVNMLQKMQHKTM